MPTNPSQVAQWLGAGRIALREIASPLRTWAAFQDGRTTPSQRRRTTLKIIDVTGEKLADLSRTLASGLGRGAATVSGWSRDFLSTIGAAHFAGMMSATGTADPAPADIDVAAEIVDRQAIYLDGFADSVATGRTPVWATIKGGIAGAITAVKAGVREVSGRFLDRARMYADAIWGTAEKVVRSKMARDGYQVERRVLSLGAEHHCSDCPRLAALGWQPIGTLPPPGEGTSCLGRCRCYMEYDHRDTPSPPVAGPMAPVAGTRNARRPATVAQSQAATAARSPIPPTISPAPAFAARTTTSTAPSAAARRRQTEVLPPSTPLTVEQLAAVGKDGPILPDRPIGERIAAYRDGDGGRKLSALREAIRASEDQATPLRDRIDAIDRESAPIAAKLGLRGKAKISADERESLTARSRELSRERYELQGNLEPLKADSLRAVFGTLQVDDPLTIDRQQGDLIQHHGPLVRPSGKAAQRVEIGSELVTAITRKGDDQPSLPVKYGMFEEYGRAFASLYSRTATVAIDRMDSATTVAHEVGHVVESKLTSGGKALVARSREFLAYRAGDEPIQSFRKVISKDYGADEKGRKDRFDEAFGESGWYVGKEYGEYSSEILAMGVQKLYEDPARFIDRDPEYVAYLVGLLDGSLR